MMEARKNRPELCKKKKLEILSREELMGDILIHYQTIKPHLGAFENVLLNQQIL